MSNPALTEILASYVPKLIQNRIVADPSPIESPVTDEMPQRSFLQNFRFHTSYGTGLKKEHWGGGSRPHPERVFWGVIDIIHDMGGYRKI